MRTLLVIAAFAALVPCAARAASYEDYIRSVDRAIAAGNGASTMELLCGWSQDPGLAEYGKAHEKDLIAAMARWQTFGHRRYSEVFQLPARVDSFLLGDLPWAKWGFVGSSFGGLKTTDRGEEFNGGRLVISGDQTSAVVDLDLDGKPEMSLHGDAPRFAPGLSVSHDDAGDGHREQWLAAAAGANPRTRASIWVYRDGRAVSVIIKPHDGPSCGRSWCLAR